MISPRDYSTISESALSLLLMKAQSDLPFAQQAAALLWGNEPPKELADALVEENARRRLRHFVNRSRSLDQLLERSACTRVLELASGLSFRGLALAASRDVFYVDTDLPELARLKRELTEQLRPATLLGSLDVQALNALDETAFRAAVAGIPAGPLAIVNEGLLVYLDAREKAQLASHVREALRERGGTWLTADVYLQNPGGSAPTVGYGRSREFIDRHRVEQNKFTSWADAEQFFVSQGFVVEQRLAHEHPKHIRESWALRVAG